MTFEKRFKAGRRFTFFARPARLCTAFFESDFSHSLGQRLPFSTAACGILGKASELRSAAVVALFGFTHDWDSKAVQL